MTITDEKVLASMRGPGPCLWCKMQCARREVHHLVCKGMGGGSRLDVPWALASLCDHFGASCHRRYHDGNLDNAEVRAADRMRELVARREGTTPEAITEAIYCLLRTPKGLSPDLTSLSPEGARLVNSVASCPGSTTPKPSKRRVKR